MKINHSSTQVKKTALYVLLIYIAMQLSSILFGKPFYNLVKNVTGTTGQKAIDLTNGWYIALSMGIALIFTLILTTRDKNFWHIYKEQRKPLPAIVGWGILGFFLVYLGQTIGSIIEFGLGIDPGSENTTSIANIAKGAPIAIIAITVFGPILEEFVFRRVIFGSLVQTTNFWVAAFVSSVFFALVHFDFTHIILYTISGFCFAFLYHYTKSIWTSIITHMILNGFVTLVQLNLDSITEFLKQLQ